MSLFHSIVFGYLHNDEMYNLSTGIKNKLQSYAGEGQPLTPLIERHTTAHQKLDSAMMQPRGSSLTDLIAAADDTQDDTFLGFRTYLQAHTYSQEEAVKNAAERLLLLVKTYGWSLHSTSYTEQTSRMGNLINDLENNTQAAEDVATLNATEWLNTMKAAYQNFVSLNEQRLAEQEDRPDYTTLEARKEVRTALSDLFDYADVMHKISPDGTYEQLAAEINPLIDQTMQIVRSRRSREETDGAA